MARLIVEGGQNIGEEFEIAGEVRIGRDAGSCAVVLDDSEVSREHAALRPAPAGAVGGGGAWEIEDLGSRNGTFLNGERLDGAAPLHDGDHIRVGATTLLFRAAPQPLAPGEEPRAPERRGDSQRRPPIDPAGALEAALFALVLVLVFFVTSYATRIVLALVRE